MKIKLSLLTASFIIKVYLALSSFIVFLFFKPKMKEKNIAKNNTGFDTSSNSKKVIKEQLI